MVAEIFTRIEEANQQLILIHKQPSPNSNNDEAIPVSRVTEDTTAKAQTETQLSTAPITIFTLPKPFNQQTDTIQRNAIRSWKRLAPDVQIILMGDEAGIEATAAELNVGHAGNIDINEHGTPLVSSAFEIAHRVTTSPVLVYCNADVILTKDFVNAVGLVQQDQSINRFLAIGRRTDLKVERAVDFDSSHDLEKLLDDCESRGVPASIVCKEYFAFTRDMYRDVPAFAVGRGNWDNWMVASAKTQNIPVVNLSSCVKAIHQEHDYSHANKSRLQCYVNGEEARENQRLAGGRHLISGSTSTHRLEDQSVVHNRSLIPGSEFFRDLPSFSKLMLNLLSSR
jgi:hypothetical protein